MLVLTRKHGEEIKIDGDITITVIELEGNRVRLGIKAPQDVTILRGELTSFEEIPKKIGGKKQVKQRNLPAVLPHRYAGVEYVGAT